MMILQDSVVFLQETVDRILRGLREENVIRIVDNKILILNADYLKPYAD